MKKTLAVQKATRKRAKKFLREHRVDAANNLAAANITNISDSKRVVMRRIIRRSTVEGWTKTKLKDRLSEVTGLDARQANALLNYRVELESQYPGQNGRITRMIKERAAKYKKKRVQRIATYETRAIEAEAKRAQWAEDNPGRLREWIVLDDPCPVCTPMKGAMARVGEPYSNGMIGPPVHVNCKCKERLV